MNMYQWEQRLVDRYQQYGSNTLTILLIIAAIAIILIALCVRSPIIKSLVLAYVVLP